MSLTRVVAITGCDSGLGWSIAARAAREGLVTVAGMYQGVNTKAAEALRKVCAHTCRLDVTDNDSVAAFKNYVKELLKNNSNYRLHALVNNAGIMTIGDYEWQTPEMVENTINVNLLGTMRVTSAFLPDLRRAAMDANCTLKPRIINVASHCGLQPLPGFGPYCASKAGLLAWTRALRLEHWPHALAAVAFVPGGFVASSNLLSTQRASGKAMLDHLDQEQKVFYERKIQGLSEYLSPCAAEQHDKAYDSLKNEDIIETFMKTLLDPNPKSLYKVESWRYKFYYSLIKQPFPEAINRWIILRFLSFPQ